jgi:CRISPR-associated exonuclease Cas4
VFYQYCKPVEPVVTEPMAAGKRLEEAIERLERRRKTREYGLVDATRIFNLWIVSERLGLSGQIDLALRTDTEVIPVDFKHTPGPPRMNHKIQLAAYGLLLEERFSLPARRSFIFRLPDEELFEIALEDAYRSSVQRAVEEIRKMILNERFPPPADSIGKCANCEFLNFCNDRL